MNSDSAYTYGNNYSLDITNSFGKTLLIGLEPLASHLKFDTYQYAEAITKDDQIICVSLLMSREGKPKEITANLWSLVELYQACTYLETQNRLDPRCRNQIQNVREHPRFVWFTSSIITMNDSAGLLFNELS